MQPNNTPYAYLVTTGNQAVLPAASAISALAVGQIGFFDTETLLAITPTVAKTKKHVIAVGYDTTGDAAVDTIRWSAGQYITPSQISNISFRGASGGTEQVIEIDGIEAYSDRDYAIRIEYTSLEILRRIGNNQFSKTYTVRTPEVSPTATTENQDCNLLIKDLINAINADSADNNFIAEPLDAAGGSVVPDMDVFIAANAAVNEDTDPANDVCMVIRLTTIPVAKQKFFSINTRHYAKRGVTVNVSLAEGFTDATTVTETSALVHPEGDGYDMRQEEYCAIGFTESGPYRVNTSTGLAKNEMYFATVLGTKYDKFVIEAQETGPSGWLTKSTTSRTVILTPEADTVTRDALAAYFDFEIEGVSVTLTDDALAADATGAIEGTSAIDDVTLDGITD